MSEALKISPEDKMALSNTELARLKQQIEHSKSELTYLKKKYQEVKGEKTRNTSSNIQTRRVSPQIQSSSSKIECSKSCGN